MFVCVRQVILLLLINFLDLSSSSSSSSSSSQNATRPRSHPSEETDDYSVHEDITTEPPSSSSTTSEDTVEGFCDYSLCVEHQQTCAELAAVTGCFCPGLERLHAPSPPTLSYLTQQDDNGVLVHWCAPPSIVTHYKVLVKGKDRDMDREIQVEEKKRKTALRDVAAGALVCVVAVNKIGVSAENQQSCATFKPKQSVSGLALKLGIIGGVVGLIVLLILALLLWRHKKQRESSARTETRGVL
ncbi:leucine-rich repeat neuronal protein 4 [Chanodichthys erythropterus]|uniref:leucine-rich repeat neuronal protein 4 n=1 Tax=Chanodichthys erythropterus TaxID=933992 RepID=UPI00351F37AB